MRLGPLVFGVHLIYVGSLKPESRQPEAAFMPFRSGFVCILGRLTLGKSTLLNALVGEKLAIIRPSRQPLVIESGFVNVPKSKGQAGARLFDRYSGRTPAGQFTGPQDDGRSARGLGSCDVVLLIMDATRKLDQRDQFAIQMLKHSSTKVCLILNKVDRCGEARDSCCR